MQKVAATFLNKGERLKPLRPVLDRILFNTFMYENGIGLRNRFQKRETFADEVDKAPLFLRLQRDIRVPLSASESANQQNKIVHFPLSNPTINPIHLNTTADELVARSALDQTDHDHARWHLSLEDELQLRRNDQLAEQRKLLADNCPMTAEDEKKAYKTWLSDYEEFNEKLPSGVEAAWIDNYGTPDPKRPVSQVPCGGCGSLLHCKEPSLPGYLPSEIFKKSKNLHALKCQRCHFLINYNVALKVQVANSEYSTLMDSIHRYQSLIVLVVDLLDFPCSIWPNFAEILGPNKHIILAGNKVDLLPQDCPEFLQNIERNFRNEAIERCGFESMKVKGVNLISARTGFGIEHLITNILKHRDPDDNVYLVGCTNAGKSTLFNRLIDSDLCRFQTSELMNRATTSVWPGTTLNLLKFPILRPLGYRMYLRSKRLYAQNLANPNWKMPMESARRELIGHMDRTFRDKGTEDGDAEAWKDSPFLANRSRSVDRFGVNFKRKEFARSKWCYDTPGVLSSEHFLDLLTTDELMRVLPTERIVPRTFILEPRTALFIGGLARLDFLTGDRKVWITTICSHNLPITIAFLKDADKIYNELLGSEILGVPNAENAERLKEWPGLKAHTTDFEIERPKRMFGERNQMKSSAEIVLSNAGFVCVTLRPESKAVLRAWTPNGRGIFRRDPILPFILRARGKRIPSTPAYHAQPKNVLLPSSQTGS